MLGVPDTLDREEGTVKLSIGAKVVMKQFLGDDATRRISHLTKIYQLLKDKGVPNVDTLESSQDDRIFLSPVGLDVLPKSGSEAFDAIVGVLNALKVCYDIFVLSII